MAPPAFHAQLSSRIADLPPLLQALQEWMGGIGVPAPAARDVNLMLDELITNIVLHGYEGRTDGWLEVEAEARGASLLLTLRDRAPAFDPRAAPWPDATSPLEQRPIGGLGLMFVRRLADAMDYRRYTTTEGSEVNELRLTRHFAQPAV